MTRNSMAREIDLSFEILSSMSMKNTLRNCCSHMDKLLISKYQWTQITKKSIKDLPLLNSPNIGLAKRSSRSSTKASSKEDQSSLIFQLPKATLWPIRLKKMMRMKISQRKMWKLKTRKNKCRSQKNNRRWRNRRKNLLVMTLKKTYPEPFLLETCPQVLMKLRWEKFSLNSERSNGLKSLLINRLILPKEQHS